MVKKGPRASVVILNYNGKHLLKGILGSIKKITFPYSHEVLVVDNASTDGSQQFLRKEHPRVKLIQNKKNVGYPGLNSALPYCKGEYILFLNNDMKLEKSCLVELVKVMRSDRKIGMCAPKLVNFFNKNIASAGTWISRSFYTGYIKSKEKVEEKEGTREIPYMGVGLVRKKLSDKLGCIFDPDYFLYGEDVDLGLRIRLLDYKTVYVPGAMIYHMHAETTEKVVSKPRIIFLMERNLLMTFFKICSSKNIFLLFPYVFGMRFLAMAKDLIKIKPKNLFARLKAIFWIFSHFSLILKKRRAVQKTRKIKDKELFKLFTEKFILHS